MDPEMLARQFAVAEIKRHETAKHGKLHHHFSILTFLCGSLTSSLASIAPWWITAMASGTMMTGMGVAWVTLTDQPQAWLDQRSARKYGPQRLGNEAEK